MLQSTGSPSKYFSVLSLGKIPRARVFDAHCSVSALLCAQHKNKNSFGFKRILEIKKNNSTFAPAWFPISTD